MMSQLHQINQILNNFIEVPPQEITVARITPDIEHPTGDEADPTANADDGDHPALVSDDSGDSADEVNPTSRSIARVNASVQTMLGGLFDETSISESTPTEPAWRKPPRLNPAPKQSAKW